MKVRCVNGGTISPGPLDIASMKLPITTTVETEDEIEVEGLNSHWIGITTPQGHFSIFATGAGIEVALDGELVWASNTNQQPTEE